MSKDDRGWSTESHEQYMYRLNKEDKVTDKKKLKAIEKGTYEYEYTLCRVNIRTEIWKGEII